METPGLKKEQFLGEQSAQLCRTHNELEHHMEPSLEEPQRPLVLEQIGFSGTVMT